MIETSAELLSAIRAKITAAEPAPALVFNCHITGLAVARSLGRRGVPVIGLDRDDKGLGLHSRYTTIAGLCPYPLEDEEAFVELLMEIGAALPRKGVLFPCLDEWVFAVLRHRPELERYYHFPFSDLPTIEEILDKNLLYRKCLQLGIPIPKTYFLDQQSPAQAAKEIGFPCILKPALQREFTNEFGEKVFRIKSREEFIEKCEQAARHPLLAQEIVGTSTDSFYSLCSYIGKEGAPGGVFVGRKLEQYPPDFGTACLVDSRQIPEIVERGVEVLRQFGYQGISEVEFIYDERDRDFKLLDINTRVWKWIGLPIRCGVDLPWLAYSDAVPREAGWKSGDLARTDPSPVEAGVANDEVKWVYLKDYIALRRKRSGSTEATLDHQDWLRLISAPDASGGHVVDAVLSHDDPGPFARMIEGLFDERLYYCAC